MGLSKVSRQNTYPNGKSSIQVLDGSGGPGLLDRHCAALAAGDGLLAQEASLNREPGSEARGPEGGGIKKSN